MKRIIDKYTKEEQEKYIKRATRLYLENVERIKSTEQLIKVLKSETISALNDGYAEKYIHLDIVLKMLERA